MARVIKTATLLFLGMVFAATAHAHAACSSSLRYHLDLGLDFLKEAQAYDNRNEAGLAAGEWENLGHQVEMTKDDVMDCDDAPTNRDFYLLASWDALHTIEQNLSHGTAVGREDAEAFRAYVALLNHFRGATRYRADYLALKAAVQTVYDSAGLAYCSPEQNDDVCSSIQRKADKRRACSHDAAALNAVAPDYPASMQGTGLYATVTLSITIDEQGKVIGASVYKEPFPLDVDPSVHVDATLASDYRDSSIRENAAALAAARASTYKPKIVACKSVRTTFQQTFEFNPSA